MEFRQKVLQYIKEYQMFQKGDTVILGLSGGADSVCLFLVLESLQKILGISLQAVHINHNLRGKEADEDERFVRELCIKKNIPLLVKSVPVGKIAQENCLSEEEAGRKVRYHYFEEIRKANVQGKIAVAHHKNDQAETVLHHLCRGTSVAGAAGMRPVSGKIVRPFLCVTRPEIEAELRSKRQNYQTDRTNYENNYIRNRIRNQIMPILKEQVNTQVVEHLAEAANDFRELAEYLEWQGNHSYKRIVSKKRRTQYWLSITELMTEMQIIKQWVVKKTIEDLSGCHKNIEKKHIINTIALLDKQVGKRQNLPYGITVWREHDALVFERNEVEGIEEEKLEIQIPNSGMIEIPGEANVLKSDLIKEKEKFQEQVMKKNERKNCTKWFDYDKIENTVYLRKMRKGDYLQIDLAGHHKSAAKACKDAKISAKQQKNIWVVADGNHILWIPGVRVSEYYKVKEETKCIWKLEMRS